LGTLYLVTGEKTIFKKTLTGAKQLAIFC